MQQPARRELTPQAADQFIGKTLLMCTDGSGIPFFAFHVVDRHESWLATHRQSDVFSLQAAIDFRSHSVNLFPCLFGIRFRDTRIFMDPRHRHFDAEFHFRF